MLTAKRRACTRDLVSLATHDIPALIKTRDANPGAADEAHRLERESQVLETFRLILDPSNRQAPTVPVVLFVDDAQWADPATLRFLYLLLVAALAENWSLLVIATHWEFDWREDVRDEPAPVGQPTQLVDLPQTITSCGSWYGEKLIPLIPDLGVIVTAALPGVTSAQRDLIVAKAGGNFRLLDEIFKHLIEHTKLFVNGDTSGPLTKKAEREILEESFEYHDLVDKRFCRMEEHVRQALGWSSAQGMRFLASVTEAIARRAAPGFDPTRLRPALETAEEPHCLVQLFGDRAQGRFNMGEFREAAFQHVARKNLAMGEGEAEAVDSALREFLASWLRRKPGGPGPDVLEPAERRDALLMARRIFSPDQPETRGPWAVATAQLSALHASEYLWKQAHALAQSLADAAPAGWSLDELSVFWQYETASLLLQMSDLRRAHRLAASLATQLLQQPAPLASHEEIRRGSVALNLLGDVEWARGDLAAAADAFRRSLVIRERVMAEFGETPEALRDVSVSLDRVGDVELALVDREAALAAYRRGLAIRERLVAEFGETPEALRDLMISHIRLALVSDKVEKIEHLMKGRALTDEIVARGWGAPQNQADREWIEEALRNASLPDERTE